MKTILSNYNNFSNLFASIDTAAGFFIGSDSIGDSLRRLPVGEAMVQVNSPKPLNPVRCRVDLCDESMGRDA